MKLRPREIRRVLWSGDVSAGIERTAACPLPSLLTAGDINLPVFQLAPLEMPVAADLA
jgi:hypothetical protein